MKLKVFAVYDKASESFGPPFMKTHIGEATRDFENLRRDPNSQVAMHPRDFVLYQVATWDNLKGCYTNVERPIIIQEFMPEEDEES